MGMSPSEARDALQQAITGYRVTWVIHVAAKLRIADVLAARPMTVQAIAAATNTHPVALARFLRAAAAVGIFATVNGDSYGLTPISELLRTDIPGSMHGYAMLHGRTLAPSWEGLEDSVRTGQTAIERRFGIGFFDYLARNPDAAAVFHAGMSARVTEVAAAVAATYDFSASRRIVDIGGGHGTLIATILRANPRLDGVVFDQPDVVSRASDVLSAAGLTDRCEVVGGDFFVAVPGGADTQILSDIVHDWDDAACLRILANCRRAIAPSGRLLLIESVLAATSPSPSSAFLDLQMLVLTGGQERTEPEYRELLERSGYRLTQVIPMKSSRSIVESVAV